MSTINAMNVSMTKVRKAYPYPKMSDAIEEPGPRTYCVGGALCRYLNRIARSKFAKLDVEKGFPCSSDLSKALSMANPRLTTPVKVKAKGKGSKSPVSPAYAHAQRIISANDNGNFDLAWQHLGDALRFPRND